MHVMPMQHVSRDSLTLEVNRHYDQSLCYIVNAEHYNDGDEDGIQV